MALDIWKLHYTYQTTLLRGGIPICCNLFYKNALKISQKIICTWRTHILNSLSPQINCISEYTKLNKMLTVSRLSLGICYITGNYANSFPDFCPENFKTEFPYVCHILQRKYLLTNFVELSQLSMWLLISFKVCIDLQLDFPI